MKKYIYIIVAALVISGITTIIGLSARVDSLKEERDIYKSNTADLLGDVQRYKTKDSLNAATVGVLQLTIEEYKKYRTDDLITIKQLETKNRRIESVGKTELQSSYRLVGKIRDSIAYIVSAGMNDKPPDTIPENLKCINIVDDWFEMHGCANENGDFTGDFINRESLQHVQTVKYKRFLGFLWETKKIKDRKFDVVSKNPNTKIVDIEFIIIRE